MGDPKFSRRTVETPSHPWQGDRIREENEICRKYGLKNKHEVWKVKTMVKGIRGQARMLQGRSDDDEQARIEKARLFHRLQRLGFLHGDAEQRLDDILGLTTDVILARRLQTIVYLKGLSNTPKQARQFIVHGHIGIRGKKVTIPSYIVRAGEENHIEYYVSSPLDNELHPERPDAESLDEKLRTFHEEPEPERVQPQQRGGRGGRQQRGGGSKPRSGRPPSGPSYGSRRR